MDRPFHASVVQISWPIIVCGNLDACPSLKFALFWQLIFIMQVSRSFKLV